MNGREKRKKRAQRARDMKPVQRAKSPFGGLCPNGCGEPGPHFVPPSLGERGFYICTPKPKEGHSHCEEGACESCDCCAAGWCINFEDGDPWADSLEFFEHITPRPEPGSPIWQHHREAFDLWCEIACESRGFEVRTSPGRACPICGYGADLCSESGCDGDVSLLAAGKGR